MTDPIVTHALGKTFGKRFALHDVSMRVPTGQAVGLIGANGAGKSTLLKVLVNLQVPCFGRAEVLGHDSRALEAAMFQRIGYMAEGQHLPLVATVADLLAYCRPFYEHWDDALAARLLRTLDLSPATGLPRGSRGERMKAALVATLAFHPEVLILDEPLEGLDPLTREQVVDGLLELVSAEGTTVLLASHDLDVLERLLDEVAMLHDGGLVFQERLDALQDRYRLVEVTGAAPIALDTLPDGCIDVREVAGGVRFLATDFEGDHVPERLQHAFPGARLHVTRPALREAFVAHARTLRQGTGATRGAA